MKRSLLVTAIVVAISSSAMAQTDAYCRRFESRMQPGQLYQARCADRDDCLVPVSAAIKKDENHRFLYRTGTSQPVQNSLEVVQLKYVGISPQIKPSNVALSRQQVNFGCYGWRKRDYVYPAISAEAEEMGRAAEVSYDNYDQFYRYGYSAPSDRSALQDFHVRRYHNGSACVYTDSPERAGQFLFERRNDVPGFFRTAWRRSGIQEAVGPALAQPSNDLLKYQRLQFYLANYQKRPDAAGCFSFPVQGRGSSIEIAISDVEENVRARTYGSSPPSWTVSVY